MILWTKKLGLSGFLLLRAYADEVKELDSVVGACV